MPVCAGKTKFGTEALAREVAARPFRHGKKKPQLFTYQCPVCRCWHLSRRATP